MSYQCPTCGKWGSCYGSILPGNALPATPSAPHSVSQEMLRAEFEKLATSAGHNIQRRNADALYDWMQTEQLWHYFKSGFLASLSAEVKK